MKTKTYQIETDDGFIRGTAREISRKLNAMGEIARSTGDLATAEEYFQRAEHWKKVK